MSKLTIKQQEARIAILTLVSQLGGSADWPQLHRKGHHYMSVSAAASRGDLTRDGYLFTITAQGQEVLEQSNEA